MREILFRGKRIDNDEWVYGSFCADALELTGAAKPGVMDGFIRRFDKNAVKMVMHEVYRETVGQYTGQTDKNGKKVFEGDILRTKYYPEKDVQVVWEDGAFQFKALHDDGWMYVKGKLLSLCFKQAITSGLKIVGNIHENPELMEEDS